VHVALATQLTLTLRNDPGALATLCRDLADGGVNLLGLSAPESDGPHGVIQLLVANPDLARSALARAGYAFADEVVLFVELKNRPGALAKAAEKLARAGIAIRYAHATSYRQAQKTAAVIAVSPPDLERAGRLFAGR
jgi:hypothetical protein